MGQYSLTRTLGPGWRQLLTFPPSARARMKFPIAAVLLALAACQSPRATQQAPDPAAAPPAGRVATEASARAAVAYRISQLPNRQLFVPDSARVVDAGASYQVLVPRTDWAGRLPNRAAFEVDKNSGRVTPRTVK